MGLIALSFFGEIVVEAHKGRVGCLRYSYRQLTQHKNKYFVFKNKIFIIFLFFGSSLGLMRIKASCNTYTLESSPQG
jgi:hypothetical protein